MSRESAVMSRGGINSFAGNGLVNFFDKLPKKLKKPMRKPGGYNETHVEGDCRMIIVGKSGAGKGNYLLNYINMQGFTKLMIFSKTAEADPLYLMLKEKLDPEQLILGDSIADIPEIKKDLNPDGDESILVVFDDFLNESDKNQRIIKEYFTNSRKYGISTVLCSQSYHKISKVIRLQADYIALGKTNSEKDIKMLLSNYDLPYPKNVMMEIYKHCTATRGNFLFIDLLSTDPRYQVRMNFGVDYNEKKQEHKEIKD